jgi:hypothetical protein
MYLVEKWAPDGFQPTSQFLDAAQNQIDHKKFGRSLGHIRDNWTPEEIRLFFLIAIAKTNIREINKFLEAGIVDLDGIIMAAFSDSPAAIHNISMHYCRSQLPPISDIEYTFEEALYAAAAIGSVKCIKSCLNNYNCLKSIYKITQNPTATTETGMDFPDKFDTAKFMCILIYYVANSFDLTLVKQKKILKKSMDMLQTRLVEVDFTVLISSVTQTSHNATQLLDVLTTYAAAASLMAH